MIAIFPNLGKNTSPIFQPLDFFNRQAAKFAKHFRQEQPAVVRPWRASRIYRMPVGLVPLSPAPFFVLFVVPIPPPQFLLWDLCGKNSSASYP
jgi:hypothetical protein